MIKEWTIYKILTPDNKVYVGKTCSLKHRKWGHADPKRQSNKCLKESILKYGWDLHVFDIIETFKSDDVYAQGKEIFWIRTYMSNQNKWPQMNGLNLTDGGGGCKGYNHSPEMKMHLSEINKGKKHNLGKKYSQEHREKISKALKGKSNHRLGIPLPEAVKNKLRNTNCNKMVSQYDLDGNLINEFISCREASRILGIKDTYISRVARQERNNIKGYIFKYK